MSITSAFSGIKGLFFCFLPFLLWNWLSYFPLSLCRFGDRVLLFSGSTAIMLVFQTSYSQISCDFFFTPPTDPKPGNSFDAERIKRGWPNPYGFFLGFINTLLLRISVILSFVLFSVFCFLFCFFSFCFFFFVVLFCFLCRWNKPKLKLFTETLYSHGRFSSAHIKIKSAGIYWLQGQWGGVRARYCAPVHSSVFPG